MVSYRKNSSYTPLHNSNRLSNNIQFQTFTFKVFGGEIFSNKMKTTPAFWFIKLTPRRVTKYTKITYLFIFFMYTRRIHYNLVHILYIIHIII